MYFTGNIGLDKKILLITIIMSKRNLLRGSGGRNKTAIDSRTKYDCHVCSVSKRSDKLKDHYLKKVLFNKKGNPVPATSDYYITFSAEVKAHTK